MINERKVFNFLSLVVSALLVSSCGIRDLKHDTEKVVQNYGFFKGEVGGVNQGSNVVVGLFKRDGEELTPFYIRSASPGIPFYIPVPVKDADDMDVHYTVAAFSDSNGDFSYQPSEPAIRFDDPIINRFNDLDKKEEIDYKALKVQPINLTSKKKLDDDLDFSLNSPETVSWVDERFSDENVTLGMWQPSSFFEKEIGYQLYALKKFDPTKRTIVLVHGINDSPLVFESLVKANAIPEDYQLLLYYYPSAVSLELTSHLLSAALNDLIRRNDKIPQLDILAHSMGGLVSKGMILQLTELNEVAHQRMNLFISIASPFGGHAGAQVGLDWSNWSPAIARSWFAMAPDSRYLTAIAKLDLSKILNHHLIFTYSHEKDGKSKGDDGVVTVKSQLIESAQYNATAMYGIADNHVDAVSNPCTLKLVTAVLQDSSTRARIPNCGAADASPVSPDTAPVD